MCASGSACTFVCVRVGGISIWKLRNSKQTKRQKGYTNVCSKGKTPSTVVAAASCSRKRQKRKKAKKPKGKIPEKAKAKQQERSKNKKTRSKTAASQKLSKLRCCCRRCCCFFFTVFFSLFFIFANKKVYDAQTRSARRSSSRERNEHNRR